uniref:Uncharacterized protein n=1 Tax=Myoviridae sp. ctXXl13 TaxID=2827691 RepID=A0A8S5TJG4_9CAUD|nr:MAG TPA: hypothetical protein [Myoviridae sp. ctXXl13]
MIIKEIYIDNLINVFNNLLDLNRNRKRGSENIVLTDKSDEYLSTMSIVFTMEDLTYFDLLFISKLSYIINNIKFTGLDVNIFGKNSHTIRNADEKIDNYITEYQNIIEDVMIKSKDHNEENRKLILNKINQITPIGAYKFSANVIFTGITIKGLFKGFLEKTLYGICDNDFLGKEQKEKLLQTIYLNFTELYNSSFYKYTNKKGVIEDFLVENKYFGYIERYDTTATIARVEYFNDSVNFFNTTPEKLNDQISLINLYDNIDHSSMYTYYACSSDIKTFLDILTVDKKVEVVYYESFNRLYHDTEIKMDISDTILDRFEVTINKNIDHNIELRDTVKNIEYTALYNMILESQHIKFLIKTPIDKTIDGNNEIYKSINRINRLLINKFK